MNWKHRKHYVFIDLEATCAESNGIPNKERETIEIGAVLFDAEEKLVSQFQSYIRPVRHEKLHSFCTKLTGITQEQVDQAALFSEVYFRLLTWLKKFDDALIFTWGSFDQKQLQLDCKFHGVTFSREHDFADFKKLFYKSIILPQRTGLEKTLNQMGLVFEGKPHSALSDAANTARLFSFLKPKKLKPLL